MTTDEKTRLTNAMRIVAEQAGDEGLWGRNLDGTTSIVEAYLQQELRRLHEAIEGKAQEECAAEALAEWRNDD